MPRVDQEFLGDLGSGEVADGVAAQVQLAGDLPESLALSDQVVDGGVPLRVRTATRSCLLFGVRERFGDSRTGVTADGPGCPADDSAGPGIRAFR